MEYSNDVDKNNSYSFWAFYINSFCVFLAIVIISLILHGVRSGHNIVFIFDCFFAFLFIPFLFLFIFAAKKLYRNVNEIWRYIFFVSLFYMLLTIKLPALGLLAENIDANVLLHKLVVSRGVNSEVLRQLISHADTLYISILFIKSCYLLFIKKILENKGKVVK